MKFQKIVGLLLSLCRQTKTEAECEIYYKTQHVISLIAHILEFVLFTTMLYSAKIVNGHQIAINLNIRENWNTTYTLRILKNRRQFDPHTTLTQAHSLNVHIIIKMERVKTGLSKKIH